MADVAPLQPLRFSPELLPHVVAPPYDVIDAEFRQRLMQRHRHNVVHVDMPEGHGPQKYDRAKELFHAWQTEGVLVRDEAPAFWRYAQTFSPPGGGARLTRRGFFALVRSVPFSAKVVLPHERTLDGPKLDRLALSRATRATLSPQFMLYADPLGEVDTLLSDAAPFAAFATDDGVHHRLERVTDRAALAGVVRAMASRQLLIADGHHRYETSVALRHELDAEAHANGLETSLRSEHHFTYALLVNGDDPSLVVFPTHRLVHSLPRFVWSELVHAARELFVVEEVAGDLEQLRALLARQEKPALGAWAGHGKSVLLVLKDDAALDRHPVLQKRPEVLRHTAVALLHDGLLEHILGITPEAQAQKINLKYIQDPEAALPLLQSGEGQVFFLMNPTKVATVRRVAEAGEVMPQKSTFFYPKVPTGLLFHTLRADHAVAEA